MEKLILIVIVLTINACKNNSTGPGVTQTDSTYFPLKVGNSWTYNVSGMNGPDSFARITKMTVIDTVRQNGKNYFKLDSNLPPGARDTLLVRINEQGDLVFISADTERIFLKFSAPEGASWDNLKIYGKHDSAETSLGKLLNCVTIGSIPPMFYPSYDCSMTFARGIGLVTYNDNQELYFERGTISFLNLKN